MERKEQIIKLHNEGYSYAQLALLFNVSKQRIHQIVSGFIKALPKHYPEIRNAVLRRDDRTCRLCGKRSDLVVHHIDKDRKHNTLSNLITLCTTCHNHIHSGDNVEVVEFPEPAVSKKFGLRPRYMRRKKWAKVKENRRKAKSRSVKQQTSQTHIEAI